MPPNLHHMVRPFVSSGSAPGTGLMLWFTRMPPPPAGGAMFNGPAVSGVWTGPQLHWHINCLELLAVHLALNCLEALMKQARTGLHGQYCDRCIHQPTRWSTLPSYVATSPPPLTLESEASEVASRHSHSRLAQPGSRRAVTSHAPWRVEAPSPDGPADLETFRTCTGRPVASLETSHFQLFYSLSEGTLGTDALAHSWPRGLRKYVSNPVSLLAQTLCKIREDEEQVLLVAPYWPTWTWFPEDSEVLGDLPQEVVNTITSARAPSTRHAYALKWNLFVEWCSSHREDPREVPDQSRTVLFAARVGAKAVSLHP